MRARRHPEGNPWARLCASLLLALLAGGGAAWAEDEPPSFFIETITVETERLSPEIVLSESLLREGREYSESELREAVHRINRLPFVLLAEFSLRRGSERGSYELVVKVYEARRWFFQLGLDYGEVDLFRRFQSPGVINERFRFDDESFDALVGRRFAVGSRGLLFASFGAEDGPVALGYQRYNLLDRNILFSVAVAAADRLGGGVNEENSVTAQLGIPIRGNHALRLLAGRNHLDYRFLAGQEIEQRTTDVELAWVFNSLDDPVLPRDGTLFEAGLTWSETDDRRTFLSVQGQLLELRSSGREEGVVGAAARHWPVTARHSVSAGLGGFYGNRVDDSRLMEFEGNVGHQVFLLRKLEPGKWRELRFETQLTGLRQEFRDGDPAFGFPLRVNSYRLRTGLFYRNGWGLFSVVYDWTGRELE